jgi:hypothetical protein
MCTDHTVYRSLVRKSESSKHEVSTSMQIKCTQWYTHSGVYKNVPRQVVIQPEPHGYLKWAIITLNLAKMSQLLSHNWHTSMQGQYPLPFVTV